MSKKNTHRSSGISELLADAKAHESAGRARKSEKCYSAILEQDPHHAEAHARLGRLQLTAGAAKDACTHLKAAVDAEPSNGNYWLMYVEALLSARQAIEAKQVLQSAMVYGLNGHACDMLVQRIRQALADSPPHTKNEELSPALTREFDGLMASQKYADLERWAKSVCDRTPTCAAAWRYQGLAQLFQGKNAAPCLEKSLQLDPRSAPTLIALGAASTQLQNRAKAEEYFRKAVEISPESFEAHANLGECLLVRESLAEAIKHLRVAQKLQRDNPQCLTNLGHALAMNGDLDEALLAFSKAEEIWKRGLPGEFLAKLQLPDVASSREEITRCRQRFGENVVRLQSHGLPEKAPCALSMPSFYLAYHDENNIHLMRSYSEMLRKRCPGLEYVSPHLNNWSAPSSAGRKIKLGIMSDYLHNHSIGKLTVGFVEKINKHIFDVFIFRGHNSRHDDISKRINAAALESCVLPATLDGMQQRISQAELDILIYPDLGMSMPSFALAHARLAPVQATTWGHPSTTGIDTIDYFISSALIEPDDAEDHYSEKLVRLSSLPTYFDHSILLSSKLSRETLGLPVENNLYACPQSAFKFHPDFDSYLNGILDADPKGVIVLAGGMKSQVSALTRRWAKNFPAVAARSLIIDHLPQADFSALIEAIDVLLDPIHFGSGLTMYEGFKAGVPIITHPGKFARSRIVAGAYELTGLSAEAPIARTRDQYIEFATSFANNKTKNRAWREKCIQAAQFKLFNDLQAVTELESFMASALSSAKLNNH